ncbi:bacterial general secretion pathway protein f signature [Trichococcus palustris]|uniref:Bacterial general secretion pathway protein f signature n=1 Tax=Trichococcus palustris TaxID=140314 RepID=A0A143YF99_9LACT|nr:competence type IV pilus assembly protein ComGB [Trichococcus palustris]CZQ87531.1 bacterial general secretion pathway protein f signature [Trichococcus palustris]SFK78670.1 competence protein ComGB [Trichococcus palustris]
MPTAISLKRTFSKTSSEQNWRTKEQAYFLRRLGELLEEGFSLAEGLSFLGIMQPKKEKAIREIMAELAAGNSLPDALAVLGFPKQIVSQLHLALLHGRFNETLLFCADFLTEKDKQIAKLKKVMVYPAFLLLFANGMLFAIRQVLLPSLESMMGPNAETVNGLVTIILFFLNHLPIITASWLALLAFSYILGKEYLKKKTAFEKSLLFIKLPVLGKWVQLYYSFFFSREYAYFFKNGMQLNQIVTLMKEEEGTEWMKEISRMIEEGLVQGESLTIVIKRYPIFKEEFGWIVYHGELTSQLPVKLTMYSEECFRLLIADIEQKIGLLQPVLFLLVAVIVMSIYLILLMPMFSSLGGIY